MKQFLNNIVPYKNSEDCQWGEAATRYQQSLQPKVLLVQEESSHLHPMDCKKEKKRYGVATLAYTVESTRGGVTLLGCRNRGTI